MRMQHKMASILSAGMLLLSGNATAQIMDSPASHAVIMDHETGAILWSKNGSEPMVPASMTKMMTAYLIFELVDRGEIELTDKITVSADAWRRGGFPSGTSTMGLKPKDTPTVEELLHGVIIMSGNDACIALAQGISGSEEAFAERMTALAHEKGLKSASFKNATGLESVDHVISAEDLAKLARMTIEDFPQYYDWYDDENYTWREYTQANRNPLLGIEGADGLKTGHLEISGYGLTGSAERDGVRRTIVINGLPSSAARRAESQRLLRIAFKSFETKILGPENVTLPDMKVWMGQERMLPVSLAETASIPAHKAAFEKATSKIVLDGPLKAPVEKGSVVGRYVVEIEGQDEVEIPVIADISIASLGFFGRAIEGLSTFVTNSDAETE